MVPNVVRRIIIGGMIVRIWVELTSIIQLMHLVAELVKFLLRDVLHACQRLLLRLVVNLVQILVNLDGCEHSFD